MFYCVQGQITVFLISFFAHRSSAVAEVGALGRLAMVFTVLSNLLTNKFVPQFARCQDRRRLRWLYLGIIGGVAAFSLVILAGAQFFPGEFLMVLGSKYSHLQHELLLMVAVAVAERALTGTFWALNALGVGQPGLALHSVDAGDAGGAGSIHRLLEREQRPHVQSSLFDSEPSFEPGSELPRFPSSWFCRRLKMPNFGYHLARWRGKVVRALYRISFFPLTVR